MMSPSCNHVFQAPLCREEKKNRKIKSAEMITGGWLRHKYPLLLIVRTIRRWEEKNIYIYKYCIMHAAMDLMITYRHIAAVAFNNNDIFKKQLNSMAIVIGLNKTIAYNCLKGTQIKTKQPFIYQRILIAHRFANSITFLLNSTYLRYFCTLQMLFVCCVLEAFIFFYTCEI